MRTTAANLRESHQGMGFNLLALTLDMTPGRLAFCSLVVFCSAVLRGYTGFGFALAAVPALALAIDPVAVVPLVLCLEVVASLQLLPSLWRSVHFQSVGRLVSGSLVGIPIGVYGLAALPADMMRLVIALVVLASVSAIGAGLKFDRQPGGYTTLAVGALSGLLNGAAAMSGPPVILFYLGSQAALQIGRASLVFYFLLSDFIAVAITAVSGLLLLSTLALTIASLPALFAGQAIGARLFRSSLQRHYRAVAILILAAVSGFALIQSVAALWTPR